MPELPEVETLSRGLNDVVSEKTIKNIDIRFAKSVKNISAQKFSLQIKNKKIYSVGRRAKLLFFNLSGGLYVVFHLKMTGQLIFKKLGNQENKKLKIIIGGHPDSLTLKKLPHKHTRIIFGLTGGKLFFNDMRKFGWVKLLNKKEFEKEIEKYGPEPLSYDFDEKYLFTIISRHKNSVIKKLLLDQSLVAGIGNIYADEVCFWAGIRPNRQCLDIKKNEIGKIVSSTKKVLKQAIDKKGTSFSDYLDAYGKQGSYVSHLRVYKRENQKCRRKNCNGYIKKIKINGRGTHYCPRCQK